MSRLGDALRAEALSAPYPRRAEALTRLAEEADRLSQRLAAEAARRLASRDTVRDLTADRDAFRGVLRAHCRMSAGRPFWGSCTCGAWTGPNTKFNDHVVDALIDTRS
jgi:hypothetical protein